MATLSYRLLYTVGYFYFEGLVISALIKLDLGLLGLLSKQCILWRAS